MLLSMSLYQITPKWKQSPSKIKWYPVSSLCHWLCYSIKLKFEDSHWSSPLKKALNLHSNQNLESNCFVSESNAEIIISYSTYNSKTKYYIKDSKLSKRSFWESRLKDYPVEVDDSSSAILQIPKIWGFFCEVLFRVGAASPLSKTVVGEGMCLRMWPPEINISLFRSRFERFFEVWISEVMWRRRNNSAVLVYLSQTARENWRWQFCN
jgi:hypothetical protein